MKICNRCQVEKSLEEFYRDKQFKDGRASICKVCKGKSVIEWRENNREKYNAGAKAWRAKNLEHNRWYDTQRSLKQTYGITIERYQDMLEAQNHKCAICGATEGRSRRGVRMRLSVDHCHKTKKVRALLCSDCNCALGYFKDEIDSLTKAVEYLASHS